MTSITILTYTTPNAPVAPERSPKYQAHKHIADSTDTPVMILDATSSKSYQDCKAYIQNGKDLSSSHISLVETAANDGYDVFLSCQYNGGFGFIHLIRLEDWIESLELQYDLDLDNYSYEEILRTGFDDWYTGFEV